MSIDSMAAHATPLQQPVRDPGTGGLRDSAQPRGEKLAKAHLRQWERALLVVDGMLRVHFLDADAESLQRSRFSGLFIAGGVLFALDRDWRDELLELVRTPLRYVGAPPRLWTPDRSLLVEVRCLHRQSARGEVPELRSLTLERVRARCDIEGIAAARDLSKAEAAILAALCAGGSFSQIAAARNVVVGTIRKQTKSLYAKLGVHAKHEAVALAFHCAPTS